MPAKPPMRLLLISRAYNQTAGGMERLSFELIQELKRLPEVEATALTHSHTGRLGVLLFIVGSIPRVLYLARRADVVYLGDPVLSLHGWLIKLFSKKPVAVTVHGLDVTYGNPLYQLYLRLFAHLDLALPISQHAASLTQNSKLKIQNSQVITPGIHDRYFDPSLTRSDLAELLQRTTTYNLSPKTSVLFTAGRLVKRKGHAWFIEHVLPHLPANTVYIIAGDGPERQPLEELLRRNGVAFEDHAEADPTPLSELRGAETGQERLASPSSSERRLEAELPARRLAGAATPGPKRQEPLSRPTVLLLGRVSDKDLKVLYNTVDAFIQPNIPVSGDAEGFGLVLLEAALCQRSVFASRLDGIPDAIHDGQNGTLVPAANDTAWIAAVSVPLKPSPTARDYTLQTFSWPKQAQAYAAALRTLIR